MWLYRISQGRWELYNGNLTAGDTTPAELIATGGSNISDPYSTNNSITAYGSSGTNYPPITYSAILTNCDGQTSSSAPASSSSGPAASSSSAPGSSSGPIPSSSSGPPTSSSSGGIIPDSGTIVPGTNQILVTLDGGAFIMVMDEVVPGTTTEYAAPNGWSVGLFGGGAFINDGVGDTHFGKAESGFPPMPPSILGSDWVKWTDIHGTPGFSFGDPNNPDIYSTALVQLLPL